MLTTSSAKRDLAIAAAVAVAMSVPFFTSPPGHVTVFGWIFNLGAVVPLIWRRRAPFAIAVTVALFAAAVALHHRPGQTLQYSVFVAIYTVADLGVRWQRITFLVAVVVTVPPSSLLLKGNSAEEFVFTFGLPLAAFLLGTLARTNRSRAESEALRAAAEERNRIAREMHDVLAHAVSVMIVQAEAGPVVTRSDPARAEKIFETIAEAGRVAEVQVAGALGLIRGDGDSAALSRGIPELVDRVRAAGLPVDLRTVGAGRPLPPEVDVAAYRIVQEALTNSLKHAGGAAEVTLDWSPDGLAITATDTGGRPSLHFSGGRGLAGLRERVAACGGTAEAGPTPTGFRVHAKLPAP